VATALTRNSLDMPAGTMEGQQGDALIRFIGERRNPAELSTIPLTGSSAGGEVLLGDVATIRCGHMALGMQLSLPSLVGLATLAGVVVNDSILLIAFIKERFNDGDDIIVAAQNAVRDRFRAIFLTSLTTVVGLGPLLFEQSTQAQFLRPIVASLAFGLTGATFLALFVTPAMFVILHDLRLIRREAAQEA
jgi:multidrug efflux pump subunit AcrB